ncbi:MAG: hypothetical protein P8179_16970 [Candidatus Thiodiazotropha sp.]
MPQIFAKVVGCGEVRTASLMFVNHCKLLLMRFAPLTTSYVLTLAGGAATHPTTFATPSWRRGDVLFLACPLLDIYSIKPKKISWTA